MRYGRSLNDFYADVEKDGKAGNPSELQEATKAKV
jgi:hypothetical protein